MYCSFYFSWLIPLNYPTPLTPYFIRQKPHTYSNTCTCNWLWIIIIELFLLTCIISPAWAYLYTHRRNVIALQSSGEQDMIQFTLPLLHWWSDFCFNPCLIIYVALPWCMDFVHKNIWTIHLQAIYNDLQDHRTDDQNRMCDPHKSNPRCWIVTK